MNTKPLLRVLNGEAVWPPPLWLMRQAGRYLPEYRQLRAQAGDLLTAFTSPDIATEITLQPIRRYGMDAAILYSDILILPWALGRDLAFREGEGPVMTALRERDAIETLAGVSPVDRLASALETLRRVRAELDARHPGTALIGFAGAPFTVACYMVEGRGSKDHADVRHFAFAQPETFARLIDILVDATTDYLAAQAEAGAEALMLFDSWAGVLPPTLFEAYVTAPAAHIANALHARVPAAKLIGFPRLAGGMLPGYAARAEMDAIGIDTAVPPRWAAEQVGPRVALQGNLDPMALVAGGEAMETEALGIRAALRGRPHIFNLGHGIVPQTPPDNVARLVDLVRSR
ncbi:MAG TPA: uroporphyrinogen decarboxylase [Acidisphaera sp.]|nr:uroporphyrinogen decarboxylase [Acidisphaera sp.]